MKPSKTKTTTDFPTTTSADVQKQFPDFTLEEYGDRMRGGTGPTRKWTNPLCVPLAFEFQVEPINDAEARDHAKTRRIVRFDPGQTRELPCRLDRVIHKVHNGEIIGGMAPALVASDLAHPFSVTEALRAGFEHLVETNQ